jgi:hypothetical protein
VRVFSFLFHNTKLSIKGAVEEMGGRGNERRNKRGQGKLGEVEYLRNLRKVEIVSDNLVLLHRAYASASPWLSRFCCCRTRTLFGHPFLCMVAKKSGFPRAPLGH